MLTPRNLFLLLASLGVILALVFGFLINSSESMPERSHLAFVFTCLMGIMAVIGVIYWIMEKVKRPISRKIGMGHYLITLIAVICGVICTSTSHDGIVNSAWTAVPKFLALKLFTLSVGVFLLGLVRAIVTGKSAAEIK